MGVSACQSPSPDSAAPSPTAIPVPQTQSPSSSASAIPSIPRPTPTITAPPPASSSTPAASEPTTVPEPSADAATVDPSVPPTDSDPLDTSAAPASTAEALPSTYRQHDGLFELTLPPGYRYREIEDGVSFISGDRRFGGSANVVSAEGRSLTHELLEMGLKEEYKNRLQSLEWQASTPQPDGSLRVDWIGVDTNGDVLDSVSFVEQHGDYIYILNLHAINEAYANHEEAATAIVESYRLRGSE